MDETNYDIYYLLHPALRKFINQLNLDNSSVAGLASGTDIEIYKLSSTKSKDDESNDIKYANCITLNIPYAGQFIKWEVIFRNDNLSFAPDFNFFDDDFLNEMNAEQIAKLLPSWAKWDGKNPKALNNVLAELIKLYKSYQANALDCAKYSRISFEYYTLLNEVGMDPDNIETIINEQFRSVVFFIRLDVDTSGLPPQLQLPHKSANQLQPPAILMVTFQQRIDGSETQHPQLYLAANLEYAIGTPAKKHIPPIPLQGCLMDYVPCVQKLLADKIQFVCENFHLKRKYIAQLLAVYPNEVLEYDCTLYADATLLQQNNHFHYLVFITISNQFPKEKPKCTLRSIYHMAHGQPVNEVLNDYPYSPRWSPQEMVQRLFKYIVEDKLLSFKNKSIH